MAALERADPLFTALVGVVLLGTVVEGAYFFRIVQGLHFKSPPESATPAGADQEEAPVSALVPICLLAALIVAVGVHPGVLTDYLGPAARDLLDRAAYIHHVLGI
jgi:formate hydrogenlyase subunit 3/multisubunit Na+/H+ antiporter MnhD subunit